MSLWDSHIYNFTMLLVCVHTAFDRVSACCDVSQYIHVRLPTGVSWAEFNLSVTEQATLPCCCSAVLGVPAAVGLLCVIAGQARADISQWVEQFLLDVPWAAEWQMVAATPGTRVSCF